MCERREGGIERKGRSESEEKLGLLAHHSLLITWFVHASPLILVFRICHPPPSPQQDFEINVVLKA